MLEDQADEGGGGPGWNGSPEGTRSGRFVLAATLIVVMYTAAVRIILH